MFDSANSAAGRAITDSARADAAEEKIQCKVCGNVKVREETFTDLVVPVPTEKEAKASGSVPTAQKLLDERLKYEDMDDDDNLVFCEVCQKNTRATKWSEITSPPAHLCLCLNRFTFNMEKMDFTKEKTPVKIDESLFIGGYEYELYHTIIHTGKDASSGHYYAMGKRSEPTNSGDTGFYTMDDSQIKPAEVSLGLLPVRPSVFVPNRNGFGMTTRPDVTWHPGPGRPTEPQVRYHWRPNGLMSFTLWSENGVFMIHVFTPEN